MLTTRSVEVACLLKGLRFYCQAESLPALSSCQPQYRSHVICDPGCLQAFEVQFGLGNISKNGLPRGQSWSAHTTWWLIMSPTAAMGTATRSCNCLTFFDIESAHCIFRGAVNILFLSPYTPKAGSNFLLASLRKACSGTRMCSHCCRRFSAMSGSSDVRGIEFRCCSVRERA